MSLSDLASLGSFVSGLAVLASLVFLFFQMRQMTEQVRQAERNQRALTQQGRSMRVVEAMFHRLEPQTLEALVRGTKGDPGLTEEQVTAFQISTWVSFISWEDSYLQHLSGTIDPESWATDVLRIRLYLTYPSYRVAWRILRSQFGEGYRSFVDAIMREAVPAAPPNAVERWRALLAEETAGVRSAI